MHDHQKLALAMADAIETYMKASEAIKGQYPDGMADSGQAAALSAAKYVMARKIRSALDAAAQSKDKG
jgi:hypothetical protein